MHRARPPSRTPRSRRAAWNLAWHVLAACALLVAASCAPPDTSFGTGARCAFASCGSCTGTLGCGWCANVARCLVGDSSGPDDGTCSGTDWKRSASACSATTDPTDACADNATCGACASSSGCGWCADTSACHDGSSSGPDTGSCGSWAWTSGMCSNTPPPDAGSTCLPVGATGCTGGAGAHPCCFTAATDMIGCGTDEPGGPRCCVAGGGACTSSAGCCAGLRCQDGVGDGRLRCLP